MRQLRTELQTATADNRTQREENQRLRQRESAIDQRIGTALEAERTALRRDQEQLAGERRQTEGLLQDLQRRLENIGGGGHADLPVGLGLREGDGDGFAGEGGIRWVEPDDARQTDGRGGAGTSLSFPTSFGPAQKTLEVTVGHVADAGARAAGVKTAQAVYTVPTNSTLMGSVAMTALIGRVPVDGTVNDPFPFKVLVGPDNLTANGIDIPDVAGAVFSGTASGDWTLSCVRGRYVASRSCSMTGLCARFPKTASAAASRTTSRMAWAGSAIRMGFLVSVANAAVMRSSISVPRP